MLKRIEDRTTSGLVAFLLALVTIVLFNGPQSVTAGSIRPADCGGETKSPEFQICGPPPCTEDQVNTLWPTEDRNFFYQCAPKSRCTWYPVKMPCAPGTVFGFKEQVCIWECDWVDPCNGNGTVSTTTTQSSTASSTTEVPSTVESSEGTTEGTTSETTPTEPPICLIPSCTDDEVDTLWPVPDRPDSFYQCEPNSQTKCQWIVVQKLCPEGLYFDFHNQSCVNPEDWTDVCSPTSTTTEGQTTETTMSTTESPTSTTDEPSTTETTMSTTDEPSTTETTVQTTEPPTSTEPPTTSTTTESGSECVVPDCNDPKYRGINWPVTNQPESFYICNPVNGSNCDFKLEMKQCPDGLYFNASTQDCVDPSEWVESCSGQTSTEGTTTEPSVTTSTVLPTEEPGFELCEEPKCNEQTTDRLWPHRDPQKYYQCQPIEGGGWEVEEVTCPEYFNYTKQDCDAGWDDVCPPITTTDASSTTTEGGGTETSTIDVSTTTEMSTTEGVTSTTENPTESTTAPTENPTESTTAPTENPTQNPTETTTAPTETTTEGFPLCTKPTCTESQIQTLWPSEDPTLYYRCVETEPAVWEPQELYCTRNTYFDFNKQVCVAIEEWTDVCPRPTDGETTCIQPDCRTDSGKSKLYPHPDRKYFYQCAPNANCGSAPVKMPCANGTVFSYQQQVCVRDCDWVDPCNNSTSTTAKPTTAREVSTKPPQTTRKPQPTTKRPVMTTKKPQPTTKKPQPTTKKPQPTTKKPQPTTKKPQPPTTPRPKPRPTTVKPRPTTQSTTRRTSSTTPRPSPSTAGPDKGGDACIPPKCDTDFERLRLYPHPNKNFYYQCAPDANRVPHYVATERPCGPGTAFSWRYQVCVHEADWEDPCENGQNEIPMEQKSTPGPMYLPPNNQYYYYK